MGNIPYIDLLLIGIILSFAIIYQIPNSYSQLYSNENLANTDNKLQSKGMYNINNESYFENYDDNFNNDILTNDDKLNSSTSDNNKSTNNMVTNGESLSNQGYGNDPNLESYGKLVKEIYTKQVNNETLNDENNNYKQNPNNSEDELDKIYNNLLNNPVLLEKLYNNNPVLLEKIYNNLLNNPVFNNEDSSSNDFKNTDNKCKEDLAGSSVNGYGNYNNKVDDYISSSSKFSSSTSKSTSTQEPSVDTHYIQVFDKNGNFIKSWGETGLGEGKLMHPHGIAVDSNGYVYVTDERKSKVLKFDSDGNFIKEWG